MTLFVISCFEASGDQIGAELIRQLRAEFGDETQFVGIAGPAMQAEGMKSWVPWEELNFMGIAAVITRLGWLRQLLQRLGQKIDESGADGLICIDAPDFHIRLVETVERPIVACQIVSPTVWAWRKYRAKRFAEAFDTIYCLFPFEPSCYRHLSVRPVYVGHPGVERAAKDKITPQEFASHYPEVPNLALLPGSRRSELRQLLDTFIRVAQLVRHHKRGDIRFLVPTFDHHKEFLSDAFSSAGIDISLVTDPDWRHAVMRHADAALCCFGTAELELTLRGCPHVGVYRFNPVDNLLRRLLKFYIRHGSLTNIIHGREAIPEYIHRAINPVKITNDLLELIDHGSVTRQHQLADMQSVQTLLAGEGSFSHRIVDDLKRRL